MSFVQADMDNPLGQRPLNLMSRSQTLGWLAAAPRPGDYDNNQALLQQLVSMGAITQQNANDIWAGNASLDDMAVNMTMINQALQIIGQPGAQTPAPLPPPSPSRPPAGTPVQTVPYTPAPSTPAPSAAPAAAQIPPGSTIVYNATFNPVAGWTTSNAAVSALAPLLPSHGMSLLSSSVASSGLVSAGAFSISILDSVGHALISDAKSIVDSLMQEITNKGLIQSSMAVTVLGPVPPGSAAMPAPSVTAFLENNAPLVVGLILLIVILPPLIKKL